MIRDMNFRQPRVNYQLSLDHQPVLYRLKVATGIKSMRDDARLSYALSRPFARHEEIENIIDMKLIRFGFIGIQASHTHLMGTRLSD